MMMTFFVFLNVVLAWAAGETSGGDISFGQYSVPVIITVLLAIVFKTTTVADGAKPFIAIGLGIAFAVMGIFYAGLQPTFPVVVDHVLYGLMTGAAAVGLWEGFSKIKG